MQKSFLTVNLDEEEGNVNGDAITIDAAQTRLDHFPDQRLVDFMRHRVGAEAVVSISLEAY